MVLTGRVGMCKDIATDSSALQSVFFQSQKLGLICDLPLYSTLPRVSSSDVRVGIGECLSMFNCLSGRPLHRLLLEVSRCWGR
jgi:hypothetical protein